MNMQMIDNTVSFIKKRLEEVSSPYATNFPKIALILGSGLGDLADEIVGAVKIPYSELPDFPISTVEGHAGRLVIGELGGVPVVAMQGRFHYYEGYTTMQTTYPVRVLGAIGVKHFFLTNAAGGVNTSFVPGDLMLITDQINFSGSNPLIGKNIDELGPRFPDCSTIYDRETNRRILELAKAQGVDLKTGVYLMNSGPTYETPAEVRMARILGADAVGMSTVPEAIVAAHMGLGVTGISCITNMAAGILDQPLHHGEVVETANKVREVFVKLVTGSLPIIEEMTR